jgi:hypothetical protein
MDNKLIITEAPEDLKPLITGIATGSDRGLDQQLIEKSRQANILKYTPNDAAKRFGSQSMLDNWRAAGREIHWLLGANNDLAGIIWYGKKPLPLKVKLPETPAETFAIRLYDGYTGHKLAVPFMRQSLAIHVQNQEAKGEPANALWLETGTRFGYREVHRDEKRVTMVLDTDKIKEYS